MIQYFGKNRILYSKTASTTNKNYVLAQFLYSIFLVNEKAVIFHSKKMLS